ncbi:MAG: hypothetical protein IV105_01425 [Rhizobacter sp.]|nr:hypothetical protein [Rhizobacter sp.]
MTRLDHLAAASLLCLGLTACAGTHWERSFYEGMRQGADNAARQPGGRAVPQTTRLPDHDQYERERLRLIGAPAKPLGPTMRSEPATRPTHAEQETPP